MVGNELQLEVGSYLDDNFGMNDYDFYYKVKWGRIQRKCIKKMKKGEDAYRFNTYKITPKTNSVDLIAVKKYHHSPKRPVKVVWRIKLYRNYIKGNNKKIKLHRTSDWKTIK